MTSSDIRRALWVGWSSFGLIVFGWSCWITTAVINNQSAIVRLTEVQYSERDNLREGLEAIREDMREIKDFLRKLKPDNFVGIDR